MSERLDGTMVEKKRFKISERVRDILLVLGIGAFIFFLAQKVFKEEETANPINGSETELRVSRLLEEMQGVGETEVMIYETEEGVESVVVVCDGAKDLQVLLNIREAVSSALGTNQSAVKIYLKKE